MATLGYNRYGKGNVRLLRVVRDTDRHQVKELKAKILLEGTFDKAFTHGDNSQIVPTETQKNTLYVLAKKYPVDPVEEWSINVAKDFMSRYSHISAVNMEIEDIPWDRISVGGVEHNHAFLKGHGIRTCEMRLTRAGELRLKSGFKEVQFMKSTKSGFTGYIKDEFTTLKDTTDRVLATKVSCEWVYNSSFKNIPFTKIYDKVKEISIAQLAGDPIKGTYSASVQQTIYDSGKSVLAQFPEINSVSYALPNIHYYLVNFNDFKSTLQNNNEVFFTFDGAHGQIEATIERKSQQSRL